MMKKKNTKIARERPPPPLGLQRHRPLTSSPSHPFPNPCKQAGYYCPGKKNTSPSLVAAFLECGNPALFCPPGSVQPRTVGVGYYSVGGGSDGTTRDSQVHFFRREGCQAGTRRGGAGGVSVVVGSLILYYQRKELRFQPFELNQPGRGILVMFAA